MAAATAAGKARRGTAPRLVPYAFLLPAVVLFTLFLAAPVAYTVYLSLRRVLVRGLGLGAGARREAFVGLANYRAALTDPELWHGALRVPATGRCSCR